MGRAPGEALGRAFKLSVEKLTRNFYLFTFACFVIGIITYSVVNGIWKEVSSAKEKTIPQLLKTEEALRELERIRYELKPPLTEDALKRVAQKNRLLKNRIDGIAAFLAEKDGSMVADSIRRLSARYFSTFKGDNFSEKEALSTLSLLAAELDSAKRLLAERVDREFASAEGMADWAVLVVLGLTAAAIVGMVLTGRVLTGVIGKPITEVTESLTESSKDIEGVSEEIVKGAKTQAELIGAATKDLKEMMTNIVKGNISKSVEKQVEIAKAFADFLKQFVERTSAEIAMGMMGVLQHSKDARGGVDEFLRELKTVEKNIKREEAAINDIVAALKGIVATNNRIKKMAASSTEAVGRATEAVVNGEESMTRISSKLEAIRRASENVRKITESLAKITEDIKILALNMSLKVEDIRDDTGKSYGFEAMSARVQELAQEVEGLLTRSNEMIIPTIEAIEDVSDEATQTRTLVNRVAETIKVAAEESKAISTAIDKQAVEIDRIEVEAENLKISAGNTTHAVEAQVALAQEVNTMLKESEILVGNVNTLTKEASDNAKKVNTMMQELKETLEKIEAGTASLTQKGSELIKTFNTIDEQTSTNLTLSEKLKTVVARLKDVASRLSMVVKGEQG